MYIPAKDEVVVIDSSERVWRVVSVDYETRTADVAASTEPWVEWRGVPFGLLGALHHAYPGEN